MWFASTASLQEDLEAMRLRVKVRTLSCPCTSRPHLGALKEMEEEAQKLRQFTEEAESQNALREEATSSPTASPIPTTAVDVNEDETMDEDPALVDARSVYVGNVWVHHVSISYTLALIVYNIRRSTMPPLPKRSKHIFRAAEVSIE